MSRNTKLILKIAGGLLLAGLACVLGLYALFVPVRSSGPKQTPEATAGPEGAGLPNPASVFCEEHGGHLFIITASDGSQYGLCIFPDGSACDEWAYYRGECDPADNSAGAPGPVLELKPEAAAPGQPITVNGSGFGPSASIALRLGAPNAGLGKRNLATVVADGDGAFELTLTLPTEWPGTRQPIVERELIIAAVDETRGQTLALASLLNEAAKTADNPM
jgi:putative hemolysin